MEVRQHVPANVGDVLADVDLDAVRTAGFDTTTIVTATNTKAMASVTPLAGQSVSAGDLVIDVVRWDRPLHDP